VIAIANTIAEQASAATLTAQSSHSQIGYQGHGHVSVIVRHRHGSCSVIRHSVFTFGHVHVPSSVAVSDYFSDDWKPDLPTKSKTSSLASAANPLQIIFRPGPGPDPDSGPGALYSFSVGLLGVLYSWSVGLPGAQAGSGTI
jgi:hypothetical protein